MSAEIELSEVASQIAHGRQVLRELVAAGLDTWDSVCSSARQALGDAEIHLGDVLSALADGRIAEPAGGDGG
jgi:hypothetical protein